MIKSCFEIFATLRGEGAEQHIFWFVFSNSWRTVKTFNDFHIFNTEKIYFILKPRSYISHLSIFIIYHTEHKRTLIKATSLEEFSNVSRTFQHICLNYNLVTMYIHVVYYCLSLSYTIPLQYHAYSTYYCLLPLHYPIPVQSHAYILLLSLTKLHYTVPAQYHATVHTTACSLLRGQFL